MGSRAQIINLVGVGISGVWKGDAIDFWHISMHFKQKRFQCISALGKM